MQQVGERTRIDEVVCVVMAEAKDPAERMGQVEKLIGNYAECSDYLDRNESEDNPERYIIYVLSDDEVAERQAAVNKRWEGIPEQYVPQLGKPWRVAFGVGVFEDFPSKAEAQEFYEAKRESEQGGWKNLVREPFNAVEVE